MSTKYLFFDLDGTITNSAEGILNSVCYALRKLGITPPPRRELLFFIGPPLLRSFANERFGLTQEQVIRAVELYREYYNAGGIFECNVYDGIPEIIRSAREMGASCVLATCKPTVMATRILEHFGLLSEFEMVSGPELDGTRNEKHEVIAYAMEHLSISSPDQILMIGDRRDDVVGALVHNIRTAGVTWGFGSREELVESGAYAVLDKTEELAELVRDWISAPEN